MSDEIGQAYAERCGQPSCRVERQGSLPPLDEPYVRTVQTSSVSEIL